MDSYVITIARESGSGGLDICKLLSQKLDIPYYDRDLLRYASDVSGINEQLFGQADENVGMRALLNAAGKVYTGEILPPDDDDYVSTSNLFAFQAKVIKELAAEKTSCIILGRAANYLLQDYENVFRIFLHAPMKWREARVEERNQTLSAFEVRRRINKEDKRRGDYYHYYTGESWRDAGGYDVCFDTSVLGVEGTADKIIELLPHFISDAAEE